MDRVVVAVDAGVGLSPRDFAAAWNDDPATADAGPAKVESVSAGMFLPGVVELVAVPLAVNVVSTVLYDLVRRAVQRARGAREVSGVEDVEVVEVNAAGGDRVVVVRSRREVR